ncbi:hypothetical protein AWC29_22495 [Mycobacterium triplex]|uniref:Uncharacterized protein n=1 Tax=Mycobacterium triplex TaxID=47839 RepID=A0ABX3W4C1_9MYCO|nr:hypothetical protein AWC29_22495 [Mycobacterium triplex]
MRGNFTARAVAISAVNVANPPANDLAIVVTDVFDRGFSRPPAMGAGFHFGFEARHQVVLPVAM